MRRRQITIFILLGIILSVTSYVVISMYGVTHTKVTGIKLADAATPENPFVTLDYKRDSKDVIKLVKAIRSGKRTKEKVGLKQPDYLITVKMNNGKTREYKLWLSDKSGMITYVKDPDVRYTLSENAVKDIKSVIGRYKAALCKAAFSL